MRKLKERYSRKHGKKKHHGLDYMYMYMAWCKGYTSIDVDGV